MVVVQDDPKRNGLRWSFAWLSLTEAETEGVRCGTNERQKSDWEVKSVKQRMAHDAERALW